MKKLRPELMMQVDFPNDAGLFHKAGALDLIGALQNMIAAGERPTRAKVVSMARSIGLVVTMGGRHVALYSMASDVPFSTTPYKSRFAIVVGTYGDWL